MSSRARFLERIEGARRVHLTPRVIAFHLVEVTPYVELTRLLFRALREGRTEGQTSFLGLYQILVGPHREGREEAADRTARYLTALPGLEWLPVDGAVAQQAALARVRLGGSAERAVQVATAFLGEADLYLTEGSSLRRIAGIEVLDLADFAAAEGAGR